MNFGASRTQKETRFHFAETPPKVMGAAHNFLAAKNHGLAHKNEDYGDGERFVHRQSLLYYRIITFTLLPPTFTTAISPLGIEVLIRASPFFTVAVPSDSPSMVYTTITLIPQATNRYDEHIIFLSLVGKIASSRKYHEE